MLPFEPVRVFHEKVVPTEFGPNDIVIFVISQSF